MSLCALIFACTVFHVYILLQGKGTVVSLELNKERLLLHLYQLTEWKSRVKHDTSRIFVIICNEKSDTVARYNEVLKDWQNVYIITGVCYIGVLFSYILL